MGVILFKDVEIGLVPETPFIPFVDGSILKDATKSFMDIAGNFGYPVGYMQEQNGQIIQNIVPVHKLEYQQISSSSKVELALHTETAFHPYRPDYVLLMCLRGDANAATTYANIEDILEKLDSSTIKTLEQKWFTTRVDISFRTHGESDRKIPISILPEHNGACSIRYDLTFVEGINPPAIEALKKIEIAIQQCIREIVLETGDVLVIDNNTSIHGRKPFQPRYNGTDRWLQRILVRKELPPKNQLNGNVIITTL